VQSFVADTRELGNMVGGPGTGVAEAQRAGQIFLLSLLETQPELSGTATRMMEIRGTAEALQDALVELGMSSEEAATAIDRGVTRALDELREDAVEALDRDLNRLRGQGFVNDFLDLFDEVQTRIEDFNALGLDTSQIDLFFGLSAQEIVDNAELTGQAFQDLITLFPDLQGVIHEFVGDATEEERRLAEERLRAIEDAQRALDSFRRDVEQWADAQRAGSQSPLSPAARLAAAQSQFNTQLGIAQTGTPEERRTAMDRITSDASALIEAARAMFGSSSSFQSIFNATLGQVEALPAQISVQELILDAIETNTATTQTVTAALQAALQVSIAQNNPAAIATALNTHFATLDTNINGLLDFSEFTAGLNASDVQTRSLLQSIFNEIDLNGDGQITRLELIRAATQATDVGINNPGSPIPQNTDAAESYLATAIGTLSAIQALNADIKFGFGFPGGTSMLDWLASISDRADRTRLNVREQNLSRVLPNPFILSPITGYAAGGLFQGPDSGYPAILHGNEFVMRREAVRSIGVDALQFANDNLTLPGNGDVVAELRALRSEVARLREITARSAIASAEHVAAHVDGVSNAIRDGARRSTLAA
jgi:hypothetical protein